MYLVKCDVNIEYFVNHLIVIMVGKNKWKFAAYYKQIYKFRKAAGLQYGVGRVDFAQKWGAGLSAPIRRKFLKPR